MRGPSCPLFIYNGAASARRAHRSKDFLVRDVFLVGASQTPVNRDSEQRGRHLAATALRGAIEHAGVEDDRIGALYVGNMTAGILGSQQQMGGLVADYAGLSGIEAMTVEAACASGAAAARMGYLMVAGGIHDVVAVCGVERMTHADRATVTAALATAADWELEGSRGESFLSLNATLMRAYIEKFAVHADDFAHFAINAHNNAMTNPNALFHKRIDMQDHRASRVIVDPVRLYDVSPVCNGSAAIILASERTAATLNGGRQPAVEIVGSTAATAPLALARRSDILSLSAVHSSTQRLFSDAGVTHADIDFYELHDAYTIMSVLSLESAGFTRPGSAMCFGVEGRIGLDGDLPISTMGGLKARGHPVGATGVYQLVEAYLQLTGQAGENQVKNAQLGLVQNIGGTASTVINHLLRRVS
jgi:acetyl-CoA C-acetyltransferase